MCRLKKIYIGLRWFSVLQHCRKTSASVPSGHFYSSRILMNMLLWKILGLQISALLHTCWDRSKSHTFSNLIKISIYHFQTIFRKLLIFKEIKNDKKSILQSIQHLTFSSMQLTFVFPFFLLSGAASLTACSCCLGFFSWFRSLGIHYHFYIFLFGLLHCLRDSRYPTKKKNREIRERERKKERNRMNWELFEGKRSKQTSQNLAFQIIHAEKGFK